MLFVILGRVQHFVEYTFRFNKMPRLLIWFAKVYTVLIIQNFLISNKYQLLGPE